MFKHILVPTDLTERSLKALDIAVKMALYSTCRITFLHVIETIEDTDCEQFEDFYRKLGKRAGKKMDQMLSSFEKHDLVIEKEIIYGKRVNEIVKFAHNQGVDLIILSSHRIDPNDASQGWGTISYKVGILSQCPVMLVK